MRSDRKYSIRFSVDSQERFKMNRIQRGKNVNFDFADIFADFSNVLQIKDFFYRSKLFMVDFFLIINC